MEDFIKTLWGLITIYKIVQTIIATGLNDSSGTNKTSPTNLPMKNTYNTVKASDINNLLAKSEKKENELVIPTFLQSRMKK